MNDTLSRSIFDEPVDSLAAMSHGRATMHHASLSRSSTNFYCVLGVVVFT